MAKSQPNPIVVPTTEVDIIVYCYKSLGGDKLKRYLVYLH